MWNAPRTDISHPRPAPAQRADGRFQLRARCLVSALARAIRLLPATPRLWAMAAAMIAAGTIAAAAGEMQTPRLSHIDPDWTAVAAGLSPIRAPPPPPGHAQAGQPG